MFCFVNKKKSTSRFILAPWEKNAVTEGWEEEEGIVGEVWERDGGGDFNEEVGEPAAGRR